MECGPQKVSLSTSLKHYSQQLHPRRLTLRCYAKERISPKALNLLSRRNRRHLFCSYFTTSLGYCCTSHSLRDISMGARARKMREKTPGMIARQSVAGRMDEGATSENVGEVSESASLIFSPWILQQQPSRRIWQEPSQKFQPKQPYISWHWLFSKARISGSSP